ARAAEGGHERVRAPGWHRPSHLLYLFSRCRGIDGDVSVPRPRPVGQERGRTRVPAGVVAPARRVRQAMSESVSVVRAHRRDVSCCARSERAFFAVSVLLFAVCATVTIVGCASMSAMSGMKMPGGWTMSMAWMRMPGQTWLAAATSFLGMWIVMMTAMMLPSLVPTLWRCRSRLAVLVAIGYFFVLTMVGVIVFPLGVMVTTIEMQQPAVARAVPIAAGVLILIAGALQFTEWKARHLACCRNPAAHCSAPPMNARAAVRYGMRLGIHCCYCCTGLTVILLVAGVMDV